MPSAGPSSTSIIFGVVGVVVVLALGGYFAVTHVSSVKEETTHLVAEKAATDAENASVTAQLAELGQKPTTLSWESVAVAYMKEVTDKAAARTNYPRFLTDMATVLPRGAWFNSIIAGGVDPNASAAVPVEPGANIQVKYDGYALTIRDVSTIISNLNALSTIEGAELATIDVERSRKGKIYRHFTLTANLLNAGTSGEGLVGDGGVTGLALEPRPVQKKVATTVVVKKVVVPGPLDGLVSDTSRAGGSK